MRMYILDANGQIVFELTELMEGGYLEPSPSRTMQLNTRIFIKMVLQFILKQKQA